MRNKLLHHPLSHLLLILVLGTLAYANTFGVPFVLDDLESITRNDIIRDLGNYLPGGSGYDFLFRRWVGYFTLALNYHAGGLDVGGYHLFNLVVHLSAALLLYVLLRLTFRTPFLHGSQLAPRADTVALLGALFFLVHPVQTQAVTYTVQRLTSLCTLFYLLALVLYVAARLSLSPPAQESTITPGLTSKRWRLPLLLGGSVLAALLAMHTKEIAFTLPIAALLYEGCFFRGAWQPRALMLLPLLLTLAIIPVLVLTGGELSPDHVLLQTRTDIPRLHYLLTQLPVIVTYLRLLVLPIGQNLDYDYPLYTTFLTPPVFLSALLLTAIGALAGYLFLASRPGPAASRQPSDPALRLIAFGVAWFFLTLAVESSLVPLADVIFEHRLYLPSIGLFAALAVAVRLATRKSAGWPGGRLPILAAALVIVILTVATWQRNQIWQSEIRLWQDVVKKSPGKARPWYNLGTHLTDAGRPKAAIRPLLKAVALDPQNAEAWHNLGRAYLLLDQVAKAITPLRNAVRIKPDMENGAVNLAAALIRTGNLQEAVPLLERVRQRSPDWAPVRFNLGITYAMLGNIPAAKGELAALNRLDPGQAPALADLINRAIAKFSPP